MKLRTVKRLYYIALLALVVLVPMGRFWTVVACCAGVCYAAFLFLLFKFWRCPFCGKMLGRMVIGDAIQCPHCKEEIKL